MAKICPQEMRGDFLSCGGYQKAAYYIEANLKNRHAHSRYRVNN